MRTRSRKFFANWFRKFWTVAQGLNKNRLGCEILEIYSSFCIRKRIKVELIKFLSCMGAVFKLLHVGSSKEGY